MKKIFSLFFISIIIQTNAQNYADSMALFFVENPKTSSVFVIKNGVNVGAINENKILPIGAMSDILVALELGKHTAYKLMDTAERVPLKELVKYYFENANQMEYETWLSSLIAQHKIKDNTVSLYDIANGMLQYGVLVNTEYLMDRVGFDNIKSSIQSYNLTNHTAILPPIGALALYQNRVNTNEKKILKAIQQMDEEEYCKAAFIMHLAIKNDSTFKDKLPKKLVNKEVLESWSDRLPQASTKTYATLMQSILQEKMLDAKYYKMLRKIIEWPMQYKEVNTMFDRFTMKGSNTINTFSQAEYGKLKDGTEVVLVYTCTNLKPEQIKKLTRWHEQFELAVFTNKDFAKKLNIVEKNTKKSKM